SGATKRLTKAKLTDEAKGLSADEFYRRYGDRYVSGVVLGVEVVGIIHIHAQSEDDKESLAVSLGISKGPVSFNSSIKTQLEQKSASTSIDVTGIGIGTSDPATDSMDAFLADVDAKLKDFTSHPGDPSTQTVRFVYSNYYGLDGYPGVPARVPANVAAHADASRDFYLYSSLANDFARAGYDMTSPLMADIQGHADALKGYLTQSLTTTPDLPATRPSIDPSHAFESFARLDKVVDDAGF